jgi:hypothetical protein
VGVPGLLDSEFEALMKVSMGTVRTRAARVREMACYYVRDGYS